MKIRHKLLWLLAATAAAAGVLIALAVFPLISSAVEGRYTERLRSEADLLASLAATVTADAAPQLARDWGARLDLRVTLLDREGRVLGDSSASNERLRTMANHADRPEVREAVAGGWGRASRVSDSTGEAFFYLARRVDGTHPVAIVRIALPRWQVRRAETPYFAIIVVLMGAAPVLLTLLAYGAVRRWSRPAEELAAAATRIAAGRFDTAIPVTASDELGDLSRAMDTLRRDLGAKIGLAESERRLLNSVISGMHEGLVLVDERHVLIANDAFRQAWGIKGDPTGRPLAEVVRHPQLLRAVDAALSEGRDVQARVTDPLGAGRAFEMHASRLSESSADRPAVALVVLFDMSRIEALEAVRKEFVANVTHELRTPLTSIKAAVLTLLDGCDDPVTTERFLGTIRRNAERMAALVEDLTDLSLIETGGIKLDRRTLDASAIARDVVAAVGVRHAALKLDVKVDMPEPFTVEADRRRLEQILVNLVDNAMKFNRPGGSVTVRGRRDDDRALLTVEDSGPGIPSDQLDKVFHRFHRVDPARSQELGGTGLGLAIVKHLVQLHGGTVRVESELGQGARFIVAI